MRGCSCAECRQLQSGEARARGRRKAQDRLPTEVRQQLLDAIYEAGRSARCSVKLDLAPNQVWGLTKTDKDWSAALEAALTATAGTTPNTAPTPLTRTGAFAASVGGTRAFGWAGIVAKSGNYVGHCHYQGAHRLHR
jgi:hypothetical protein